MIVFFHALSAFALLYMSPSPWWVQGNLWGATETFLETIPVPMPFLMYFSIDL